MFCPRQGNVKAKKQLLNWDDGKVTRIQTFMTMEKIECDSIGRSWWHLEHTRMLQRNLSWGYMILKSQEKTCSSDKVKLWGREREVKTRMSLENEIFFRRKVHAQRFRGPNTNCCQSRSRHLRETTVSAVSEMWKHLTNRFHLKVRVYSE